jgi:tetratricopeptide (TPR) repeat protein
MRVFLFCLSLGLALPGFAAPKPATKETKTNTPNSATYRKIANDPKKPAKEREEALRWLIKNRGGTPYWLTKEDFKTYSAALIADYQSLLQLCPEDGALYYEYALEAERALSTTVALNAHARALSLGHKQAASALGRLYINRKDFESALPYWEIAVEAEPANSAHWASLARSYYVTKNYEGAADAYDKAFALNTNLKDQNILEAYSQALLYSERYTEAIKVAERMLSLYKNTETFLVAARVFADTNQPENAIFYYVRALEDASNRPGDRLALVLNNYAWFFCTTKSEKYQSTEYLLKAFRMSARSLVLTKRNEAGYIDTLAEIYYLLGFPEQAVTLEKEAIDKEPDHDFFIEQLEKYEAALTEPPLPQVEISTLKTILEEVATSTTIKKW